MHSAGCSAAHYVGCSAPSSFSILVNSQCYHTGRVVDKQEARRERTQGGKEDRYMVMIITTTTAKTAGVGLLSVEV